MTTAELLWIVLKAWLLISEAALAIWLLQPVGEHER